MTLFAARIRIEIIALLVVGALALGAGMRAAPLVDWDEATYAEIAHEAVQSGSYLNFTWNGEPYLKKPPLLFWAMIASFKTFGESEWSARLPSVACGIGTMLLLYFFATPIAGRCGGLLAGILPLGFFFFVARGGRECATDAPLVFFSTLALYAFTRGMSGKRHWLVLAGAGCGLAILSKGLAGCVPLAVAALAIGLIPEYRRGGFKSLILIAAPAALIPAPWLLYEMIWNGQLFWAVFVKHETLMRLTAHIEVQRVASADTFASFVREVRPLWMLMLPLAGLAAALIEDRSRLALSRIPPPVRVWLLWLGVALAAAAAVQTKLGWYVLPALIPVALLGGALLGASFASPRPSLYRPALGVLALALLAANAPRHWSKIEYALRAEKDRSRPAYNLGKRAQALSRSAQTADLYFVGIEMPTLVYYSRLHTHFVAPLSVSNFQLLDLGANSLLIEDHEALLVDADGADAVVGNLSSEWNFSGPPEQRRSALSGLNPSS